MRTSDPIAYQIQDRRGDLAESTHPGLRAGIGMPNKMLYVSGTTKTMQVNHSRQFVRNGLCIKEA